jgi:ATP-dependent Lon protease
MTGEVHKKLVTFFLYSCSDVSVVLLQITLRGRVSPVGGIKEKVLGAHRAGANRVILPRANRKDVEHDVAKEVRTHTQFVFVRTVREVVDGAFGPGSLPWHAPDAHPLVASGSKL